jgi:hypothetical protein
MINERHRRPIWKASAALSLLMIFLTALCSSCEGGGGITGGGEGDSCRKDDDCNSDLYCFGPNRPNVCGIPPRELCSFDMDCGIGTFCHAIADPCSPDGIGSECKEPCTPDSCGPSFRCNQMGACEPIPCDDGFTCPDRQKCDPPVVDASVAMHARSTGCVDITCSDDTACPREKSCVTGYCQDGPGTCGELMAVP